MLPDIYYSNGEFLVFSYQHALQLRRLRIIGQFIGCSPQNPHQILSSGLPCLLSHYAVSIVLDNRLAKFKKMRIRESISAEENKALFEQKMSNLIEEAKRKFVEKRIEELTKREINPTPDRIGEFCTGKMKMIIAETSNPDYSSFDEIHMFDSEVTSVLRLDNTISAVFKDLYQRGFYVNSGQKYGSDFLVYLGDPVRYHAQYAIRVVENINGKIDLNKVNYTELNTLQRLCHTVNKICLFAVVFISPSNNNLVKYWKLKTREYIAPDSHNEIFESVEPELPIIHCNKKLK